MTGKFRASDLLMTDTASAADLRAEIATLRAQNQRLTHTLANSATDAHMMERERASADQLARSMMSEQQRQINLLTLQNALLAQRLGELDAENSFLREEMRATAAPPLSAVRQGIAFQEQTPVHPDEARWRGASGTLTVAGQRAPAPTSPTPREH